MIEFLKSLFKSDPAKKLIKARDKKYLEALSYQRNGNLREYARLTQEINDIEDQIAGMTEKETSAKRKEDRSNVTSTDYIDYDGMGNQGRFPSKLKK